MKITLEHYEDKYSIETNYDGLRAGEVLSHMCNLMMCAGFTNESLKQAIYERTELYEYEDEISRSQNLTDYKKPS